MQTASLLRLPHRQLTNASCMRGGANVRQRRLQNLSRTWVARAENEESTSGGPQSDLEKAFAAELQRRRLEGSPGPSAPSGEPSQAAARDPFTTTTRTRAPPPPKIQLDGTQDQRQRSINMVNEGLEGLIPRASQLLRLGGGVFLAFLPFMLVFSILFSGIYFVFGDSFVHGGTAYSGPREYIDPERLLSESTVDPYVPFQR